MKTVLGFSKEYLDSLTLIITHERCSWRNGDSSLHLDFCSEAEQYISLQPKKKVNVEKLVSWACENKTDVFPASWCYLKADRRTEEETYFLEMTRKTEGNSSRDHTKTEKKNIIRFIKATAIIRWRKVHNIST